MYRDKILKIVYTLVLFLFILTAAYPQSTLHPARFWDKAGDTKVQCGLCPRRCLISQGQRGFCRSRINKNGELFTLAYNNPVAVALDPIEKKPFFHVLPGTKALSIAVAGCNLRCLFCQNWHISQAAPDEVTSYNFTAQQIVSIAQRNHIPSIVFTYTEPTIFYEYMFDIAKEAKQAGLMTGMHSCGYINEEPLKQLIQYLDFVNIDLKSFDAEFYQKLSNGASVDSVLQALKIVNNSGTHLEITVLLIPGKNDSPQQIKRMAQWIKDNLGDEVPLHFSRFHPQFKLKNLPPTPISVLRRAYKIARDVGLKYVYIGNIIGIKQESTFCPNCGSLLIKRKGYVIIEDKVKNGACPNCGIKINGVWHQ
jgi:pyruvate formate lyase activating enzyme